MSDKPLTKTTVALGGRLDIISTDLIDLGDRYREDLGNIEELILSIKELGQLQNLVVTESNGRYNLRAGGRRLVALQRLQIPEARCLVFSHDLTELDILRIELEENSRRKDFGWKEEVKLKKRIYDLMIETHGEKSCSMDTSGISMRDVAKMADVSPATMSLDTALARAIERIPEVFEGCKNKSEARKQLTKISDSVIRQELAQRCTQRIEASGAPSSMSNLLDKYIIKDFFDGVKDIPDSSINLVELDPPYGIDLQKNKYEYDSLYDKDDYNEISVTDYLVFITNCLTKCYRVMAEDSWLILWHASRWKQTIYKTALELGFSGIEIAGKWIKPTGQCQQPTKYLANACEEFFYLCKGDPQIVRQGRINIFNYNYVPATKKIHPAERPLDLMMDILSTFTYENSNILVPFLGSGKTLLAAKLLNMNAFGYELTPKYKDGFIVMVNEYYEKGLLK